MSPEEFAKARQQASQTSETKENLSPEEEARRKAEEAAKGTYIGDFKITFYTPDPGENGGYTTTATGKSLVANVWRNVRSI